MEVKIKIGGSDSRITSTDFLLNRKLFKIFSNFYPYGELDGRRKVPFRGLIPGETLLYRESKKKGTYPFHRTKRLRICNKLEVPHISYNLEFFKQEL